LNRRRNLSDFVLHVPKPKWLRHFGEEGVAARRTSGPPGCWRANLIVTPARKPCGSYMKRLFIVAMLLSVRTFGADTEFPLSRFFVYDLEQVPYVKERVLMLSLREDHEFQGLPEQVLKELETDEKADRGVTFRLLELPPESPYSKRELSIISIRREGKLLYDATVCPVHSTQMRLQDTKITYGLPAGRREFYEAQQKYFPYASRIIAGGCVVTADSRKVVPILICHQCEEAKNEYQKKRLSNQQPLPTPTSGTAGR